MITTAGINFCNKLMLAPMVRGSRLPMRILALRHGADLVYTDEHIDYSLLLSNRKYNEILNTFDYVDEANGNLTFRTNPVEKNNLVFQIGTSDPKRAVKVAQLVENDVSAIDVNMGCPLPFSTNNGMGSALLSQPKLAREILEALVANSKVPITCKIRILDDIDKTIELVKEFEKTGISAVAVHGRTKAQKHDEPVNIDAIRAVAENVNIPIIANGGSNEIMCHDDIIRFRDACGVSSVMIARAAQTNVSVFRRDQPLPLDELIREYLKVCVDFDNSIENTKYSIQVMHRPFEKIQKSEMADRFDEAKSLEELCEMWNLHEYAHERYEFYRSKGLRSFADSPVTSFNSTIDIEIEIRKFVSNCENIKFRPIKYREEYYDAPKTILHAYADRKSMPQPTYETIEVGQLYHSIITFDGKKYAPVVWQQNVEHAEQNAALVCASCLGLHDDEYFQEIGLLFKVQ